MLDPFPQQASNNDCMALTVIENVSHVPFKSLLYHQHIPSFPSRDSGSSNNNNNKNQNILKYFAEHKEK